MQEYILGEDINKILSRKSLCIGEILPRDSRTGDSDIYSRLIVPGFKDQGESWIDVENMVICLNGPVTLSNWLDFAERIESFHEAVELSGLHLVDDRPWVNVKFKLYNKIGS